MRDPKQWSKLPEYWVMTGYPSCQPTCSAPASTPSFHLIHPPFPPFPWLRSGYILLGSLLHGLLVVRLELRGSCSVSVTYTSIYVERKGERPSLQHSCDLSIRVHGTYRCKYYIYSFAMLVGFFKAPRNILK